MKKMGRVFLAWLVCQFQIFSSIPAWALPQGEQVIAGNAQFERPDDVTLNITTGDKAIIEYNSFSIAQPESVNFFQPSASSIALNRVTGGDPSSILGRLSATGKIFLINPNGILFGVGSQVDTAGFVASVLDIANDDFLSGNYKFEMKPGSENAAVINHGLIKVASGGFAGLVGPQVENHGLVIADQGKIALASGEKVTLDFDGDGLINFVLEGELENALVSNAGTLRARGGEVLLSARAAESVINSVVNNEGLIDASGVEMDGGVIRLVGDGGGVTANSGTLDASSEQADGGTIHVLGDKVGLFDGEVNASGATGGGEVLIGGDYQGKNAGIRNASRTYMSETARIYADALGTGNGGRVILWSDLGTQVYGSIYARGGAQGGNGGFIETSGAQWLDVRVPPDVSAALGIGGEWLLDPNNLEIVAGNGNTNINNNTPFVTTDDSAQLGVDLIIAALGNGDVTISTGTGGGNSQIGNLTWTADMDFNTIGVDRTLVLNAHNNITINGSISQSGTQDDFLSIIFNADSDSNGGGAIVINNSIATGGGYLLFQDSVYLAANLDTSTDLEGFSGGGITFQGDVLLASNGGITLTTTGLAAGFGGNINFQGTLDSGNSYSLINETHTWTNAVADAESGDGDGVGDTYLATVTSGVESAIVTTTANNNEAWLGGSDSHTEGTWRWVTGPEGLEEGGLGRQFWLGAADGTSDGAYENWNTNEPNDHLGGEDALQGGAGSLGLWNDLPVTSELDYYVLETNLADTALTINADTGTVTFGGAVGANKTLGALNVNSAGAVNINAAMNTSGNITVANSGILTTTANGDITTAGAFTQNGTGTAALAGDITAGGNINLNRPTSMSTDLTLFAGDNVNVVNNITRTAGGSATLRMQANNGVIFSSGADITASNGSLNVILNSDRDANEIGNINLGSGTVITSNGGEIILSGGNGDDDYLRNTGYAWGTSFGATQNRGVYLTNAQLLSGAGNITIRGHGDDLNSTVNQGVDIVTNSVVESSTGTITINGVAGNGSAQNDQKGVVIYDGARVSTTDGGNINITGRASDAGTGEQQTGVQISGAGVRATGAGTVTITGTGGAAGASTNNYGILIEDSGYVEGTGSGAITLNATRGNNSTALVTSAESFVGEGPVDGSYSGDISLNADKMHLTAAFNTTGTINLAPLTAGTLIDLGNVGDGTANTLEISGAELQRLTAGNLVVGNAQNGNITVHTILAAHSNNISGMTTLNATRDNARIIFNGSASTFNALTANADDGIDVDVGVTTDTGALIFNGDFDNAADTFDNIDLGAVLLTSAGAMSLTAATGGILLSGINSSNTTLDANGDALLTLGVITDTNNPNLTASSEGGISLAGATNLGTGTYTFNTDNDDDGTETLAVNGAITGDSTLTLRGGTGTNDTMDLNADITANRITMRNAAAIDLAGGVDLLVDTGDNNNGILMNTSVTAINLSGADGTTNLITASQGSTYLANITDDNNVNLTVSAEDEVVTNGGTNLGTGTYTFTVDSDNNSTNTHTANGAFSGNATLIFEAGGTTGGDNFVVLGDVAGNVLTLRNFAGVYLASNVDFTTHNGALSVSENIGNIFLTGTDGTTHVIDGNGDAAVSLANIQDTNNVNLTVNSEGGITLAGATSLGSGTFDFNIDNDNDGSAALSVTGAVSGNGVFTIDGTGSNDSVDFDAAFSAASLNVSNSSSVNFDSTLITTGALSLTLANALTQAAAWTVGGLATLAAGAGNNITLNNASNDFNMIGINSGNNVNLRDANTIDLAASTVSGTLGVTTAGAITDSGDLAVTGTTTLAALSNNDITLNSAGNNFSQVDIISGRDVTLVDTNAIALGGSTIDGTLNVTAAGAITDSGNLSVAGTTTLAAGAGNDITLNNAGNNFATLGVTSGRNVTVTDTNALNLAASTISGTLNLTTAGNITQTGALAVTSSTTINAGTGAITLSNAANDFGNQSVSLDAAGAITVTDSNSSGMALGRAVSSGGSDISITADSFSIINTTLNAGVGALSLIATDTGIANGSNSITINQSILTSGDLNLTSASGRIYELYRGIRASGTVTLTANDGNNDDGNHISLTDGLDPSGDANNYNLFSGTVNVNNAHNVTITGHESYTVGNVSATGDVNFIVDDRGETAGNLTLNGTITGASGKTLFFDNFGSLAGTIALGSSAALSTNGAQLRLLSTSTGDITSHASSTLTTTNSGAMNVSTEGAINLAGTVTASGTLTLTADDADDVTVNNAANDFGTVVVASGNNVTLRDTNAINLGASTISGTFDVTAGTTITDSGNISADGGASTFSAAAGITLDSSGNDFASVTASTSGAGDISIVDTDSITLTEIETANGAISVNAGANTITANGDITAGTGGAITLTADEIDLLGGDSSVSGTGTILLQPSTTSATIGVGDGDGTLSIDQTDFRALANGFSNITIGRADGTGDVDVDDISMFDSLIIRAPAGDGDITISGNILNVGFNSLTLQAGDSILTTGMPRLSSTGAAFDIIFNADRDGNSAGYISLTSGTEINSSDGEIILSGGAGTTADLRTTGYARGVGSSGAGNRGVYINGTQISSGAGAITIRGQGADSEEEVNQGVDIVTSSMVQSSSGNITINGVAGNGGAQNNQAGVVVFDGSQIITTGSGNISITGAANNSGTGNEQRGVAIVANAVVRANNTGTITITGSGGSSGASTSNYGIWLNNNSRVEGGNDGSISLIATAGNNSPAILADNTSSIGEGSLDGAYSGDITLTADSMALGGAPVQTTGTATLLVRTAGTLIDLGSTVDTTANTLELAGAELQQFTVGNLIIGDGTNGNITVHGISAANSNNVSGTVTLNATRDNARVIFNSSDSTFNTLTVNADDGIDIDVSVTTDTGALTLDGDADDAADTNDNIDLAGGVTLTSAGALNLSAATGGLILSGGDGTTTTLDVNGDTLLTLPAIADTNNVNFTVNSEGGITLGALTSLGSGTYTFTADNDDDGTETLTVNGAITGSSALTFSGGGTGTNDTLDLNADVTGSSLTIQNFNLVDLAESVDLTASNGALTASSNVGSINLSGANSTTNIIDGNGDAAVSLAAITDTNNPNLTVNSEGSLTVAGGTNLGTGTFTFTADNDNDSTAALNVNGAITGGTAALSFSGGGTGTNDTLNLNSLINAAYLFTQSFSAISLGADITTFTSQTYSGPLTLTANSVLTGAGISFSSTIDGAHTLAIDAGATDVAFPAGIGTTTPLTGLTIDAANWTLNGAGAFIAGNVDIDTTNNINFNFGLTTTAGGTVTLSPGGTLFIADGSTFNLDGALLQDGAGVVRLLENVTTTGDNVEFQGAVTLEEDVTVSTGAGAGTITFGSTVNGAQALTLNAGSGNIILSGILGGLTGLAAIDFDGANITLNDVGDADTVGVSGNTDVNATTDITFNGTTYKTNAASYTAGTDFNVDGGAATTFATTDDAISFNTGTLRLANGSDFIVTSGGGAITTGAIRGTSSEDVTLTSTGGTTNTVSVGAIGSTDEINTVAITGSSGVTLNGNIVTSDAAGNTVTVTGPAILGADVSIDTNNATNDGLVSFSSTINGAHALAIDAGSTDVTFPAGVGTTTPLTGLTIDAANWTLNGAGAFIAGNVDIDTTNNINFNFGLTTTAGGTVTLSPGGTLFIADGAAFNLDGAFLQDMGVVRLLDNITTTHDDLEFQGAVTLEDDVVLSTGAGAGDITLGSTINGAHTLGLNAGTGAITASGNIGAATALTGLTITQSDTTDFNGTVAAGTVTLTDTAETVSFAGLVTIGTALVTAAQDYRVRFLAGGTVAGDTTFLNTGGVTLGNDDADSITFSGGLDTRAGNTSIRGTVLTSNANMDFGRINLGGDAVINSGAGAGDIYFHKGISGFDDLEVSAGTGDVTFDETVGDGLIIGAFTVSGNDVAINDIVNTMGDVTITNDGTFTTAAAGDIESGGIFTNDGGGSAVLEGDIRAEGTITLDNAVTIPGDLLVRARGDSSDIVLSGSLTKSSGESADVSFTAGRDLTISNAITNTDDSALNLELSAGRNILLTGAAADISNNGTYTVTADSDEDGTGTYTQDNAGSAVITGNGAVSITAADIDLTGTLNSGTAATTILVSQDGRTMGFGATAGGLTLSGSELQNITATGLNFGGSANGDITVDGINAANSNNISGTVTLNATRSNALVYFVNTASTFNALTANADDGMDINVDITTDTGALTLDGDADNAADNNDYINLEGGITLTSAGAMTLQAATNGIYLNGAEGTTVTLDANGDALLTLGAVDTGDANLTANSEGGITLAGAGLGTGTHAFTVDNDNDGTAALTVNGAITGTSALTLGGGGTGTDDTLDLDADVTAGTLTIQNFNLVDLAESVDLTASNGALMASSNVGSIHLSGADETTNIIDGNGDAAVSLAAITDTNNVNLTVTSEAALTLAGLTSLGSGTYTFTADNDDDSTAILAVNGAVTGTSTLTFSGGGTGTNDTLDLNADITADALTIQNFAGVDLAGGVDLTASNGDLLAHSNVSGINFSGADATTNLISGSGGLFLRLGRLSDTNNVNVTVTTDSGIIMTGADDLGTGNYSFTADSDNSGDSLTLNGTITGKAALIFSTGGTGSNSGINLNNHVTGSSITIENTNLASLGGNLSTDGGAITNTAAASRLTASITIDTEQGNDGAAGAVNFAATSLMSDGTVDRDLTINASTTAAGQNGGAVSLGVFNATEGYINDVSIDTSAGAGGTAGSLTLHGNIELDDDFLGNASSFTVTGDGDIIISSSLTIDTEANDSDGVAGGAVDFGRSNIYASSAGLSFAIDTRNADAEEMGGSVTLGLVDDNAGANQFLNHFSVTTDSAFDGGINLNDNLTVNNGNLTLNGNLTPAKDLSLTAGTGTITLGASSYVNGGSYDFTFTADEIELALASRSFVGSGDLLFQSSTANKDIAIGGAGGTAALDLTAAEIAALDDGFQSVTIGRADGSGTITVGSVTFLDPAAIRTPGGAILDDAGDDTVDITASSLTLTAGTGIGQTNGSLDIEVDTLTSAVSAAGGIALNLLDDDNAGVTITSVDASTSGDIDLSGTTGTALRTYASVDANNGHITITSAGPVTLTSILSDTGVAGTHDISVTTSSGSISAGNVVSDDQVTLQAAGAINGVTNDNTADVTGTTVNLTASSGGIGTTTPLDFTAATAVNADTTADNANISLDSIGDALVGLVTTGSTTAGTILFRSTGAINSVTNNNVADFVARTITLIASLGGIGTANVIDFTAGGATINADTTADDSDILLDSIGDAVVGLIDAGAGDVTLNSTGAIDSASDDDTADISGATITMTAQSVGTGTALDVAATTALFTDTSSVNGSIVIDGIGDMLIGFVDAGSGNITMNTAGKMDDHAVDSILDFRGTQVILNATQGVGNVRELELLVQNGNASTPGDYTATNTTATGTIDVEAGGDILDDPDSGTTDFTSGGDTTLVSGGIIGTKENPIEVDVRGQLFIVAGSKRGIVSAMINGKTSDGQIHLLEDTEGLVIFNNRIVGGQDSVKYNNQIASSSGPQVRGVEGILIVNDVIVEPSTAPIKIDTGEGSRDIGVGGDSNGSGAPGSNQGPGDTFSNDELNALLGQLKTYLAR